MLAFMGKKAFASPRGKENQPLTTYRLRGKAFKRWTIAEVGVWLELMGLGKYSLNFKRSKVNGESLPGITAEQLMRDLGVDIEIHSRSFFAARETLMHKADRTLVHRWGVDDVGSFLESYELGSLKDSFRSNAVHGAMLLALTREDVIALSSNPLFVAKIRLLIERLQQKGSPKNATPFASWNSYRVGLWLDTLGLWQYKELFAAGAMDGIMLKYLHDEPQTALLDLNITNVMHQRSLISGLNHLMGNSISQKASRRQQKVASMSAAEVGAWLASKDFSDRRALFESNGVHGALLVELEDTDLHLLLGITGSVEGERLCRELRHFLGRDGSNVSRLPPTSDGMPASPPPAAAAAAAATAVSFDDLPPLCHLCGENNIDCVILGCGHKSMCTRCAATAEDCPVCDEPISSFFPLEQAPASPPPAAAAAANFANVNTSRRSSQQSKKRDASYHGRA